MYFNTVISHVHTNRYVRIQYGKYASITQFPTFRSLVMSYNFLHRGSLEATSITKFILDLIKYAYLRLSCVRVSQEAASDFAINIAIGGPAPLPSPSAPRHGSPFGFTWLH